MDANVRHEGRPTRRRLGPYPGWLNALLWKVLSLVWRARDGITRGTFSGHWTVLACTVLGRNSDKEKGSGVIVSGQPAVLSPGNARTQKHGWGVRREFGGDPWGLLEQRTRRGLLDSRAAPPAADGKRFLNCPSRPGLEVCGRGLFQRHFAALSQVLYR